MTTSKHLKVPPLTLEEFKKKYNITDKGYMAYYSYLTQNTKIHHYPGFNNLGEWYQNQTKDRKCSRE